MRILVETGLVNLQKKSVNVAITWTALQYVAMSLNVFVYNKIQKVAEDTSKENNKSRILKIKQAYIYIATYTHAHTF